MTELKDDTSIRDYIPTIIIICILGGIFIYGLVYWFGGQREIDNAKDESLTWYQNGTVLGKTSHWWGESCLVDADDGKRYYEDSCSRYVNGDKVILEMYDDYYRWIKGFSK